MTFSSDSAAAISETPGPSRVVAILGMHRSGTSLLAGTLQECGLDLGAVSTSAPANEKGNRESWLLMALHEDLLRQAGGAWDRPPARQVVWDRLHLAVRDLYISSFAGSPIWGFKDPRALLVLDGWLAALPGLETVGIFRHPGEVAASLRQRMPARFTPESGLALWLAYNRRLLAWHDCNGCPLVEYGADRTAFNAAAGAVAGRLGLSATPVHGELTFYEDRLRHQSTGGDPLPAEVSEVYAALRERAAPQAAAGGDS
jgi:hypothetical protein